MDGCVKCIGLIVCPHFAHLSQISPRALGRASFEICEGVRSLFVRNGVAPYNERVGQGCECAAFSAVQRVAQDKVRGREKCKMSKVEQKARKNYAKRDSYALAFRMIDHAVKYDCPLQAITIEESILADRLWATLNVGKSRRSLGTMNAALVQWKPTNGGTVNKNAKRFDEYMEALYPRLKIWWKDRNKLLHGIAKSFQGDGPEIPADDYIRTAMTTASEGLELVNAVMKWSRKQIRRSARSERVKK